MWQAWGILMKLVEDNVEELQKQNMQLLTKKWQVNEED